jgi:hypothetical protein
MRRRFAVLAVIVCFVLTFGAFSLAKADTLLFPVIAVNQPAVTTIVSVFNLTGNSSTHLHYIYRQKDALVMGNPNYTGTCTSQSFTRNTLDGDLVSFDASGVFNGGNALFNDPNTYDGPFNMSGSGPRRAYLIVTNSNASGTRVNVADNQALGGEAVVMDIATGAAWGYRAINDIGREDYTFTVAGVGTAIFGYGKDCKWFPFFPTNEWTTKLFVTPIGSSMDSANITSTIELWNYSNLGVTTRGGTIINYTNSQNITCTGAIDITDMMDATALAAVQNIGGFTWLCENNFTNPLVAYKLEYVVNNPTYGGTNNNGLLLSTNSTHW